MSATRTTPAASQPAATAAPAAVAAPASTPLAAKPTASKPAVTRKAPAKAAQPAAKAATKAVAKPKAVAAPAAAAAPKTAQPAPATAAKEAKTKKPKLVRDSFTIPKDEYAAIEALKQRTGKFAQTAKKSELLRAGLKLLAGLGDDALLKALQAVPSIKTGRPKADDKSATPVAKTAKATRK